MNTHLQEAKCNAKISRSAAVGWIEILCAFNCFFTLNHFSTYIAEKPKEQYR